MGWAFDNCSIQSQKPYNTLIFELSSSNSDGRRAVSSFVQYLKEKRFNGNVSTYSNENIKDNIIIRHILSNKEKKIFEGNDLQEQIFDSLYKKLI